MGLGLLYAQQKKPEEAEKIYSRLAREYPDSEQAKNIVFSQGVQYLDMGQTNEAIRVFEKMLTDPAKFVPAQFLQAGQAMRDARQFETAVRMFEQARKAVDQPPTWQAATLGLGQSQAGLKNYAEAVKSLEELIKKFPTSGYKIDVGFLLGTAYAELAAKEATTDAKMLIYNKAISAINSVRVIPGQGSDIRARADVETAKLQRLMGQREEAQASYQRIILLHDTNNPKVQPWVERALEEGIPLVQELGRWADVEECCEIYLKDYPQGRLVPAARQWRDAAKLKTLTSQPAGPAGK
jgi:tetratricopeptide (TPR) repeat protein